MFIILRKQTHSSGSTDQAKIKLGLTLSSIRTFKYSFYKHTLEKTLF